MVGPNSQRSRHWLALMRTSESPRCLARAFMWARSFTESFALQQPRGWPGARVLTQQKTWRR